MSAHDGKPIRVALIEDNETFLELLRCFVNRSPGLICVGAYLTGEEALRQLPLLQPPPDLVVVDLHLPGVSGVLCIELLPLSHLRGFEDPLRAGERAHPATRAPGEPLAALGRGLLTRAPQRKGAETQSNKGGAALPRGLSFLAKRRSPTRQDISHSV